jgi:hypothetical protein
MKISPIIAACEPAPHEVQAMAGEAFERANRLALDAIILQGRAVSAAPPPMAKLAAELAAEATAFAALTVTMAERIAALEARAAA